MIELSEYKVPKRINYIAAFLTFNCQLGCSYCINKSGFLAKTPTISYQSWIRGLSRLQTRADLPITLQGGEPTVFKGFYDLVKGLPRTLKLDLLTNGQFDIDKFIRHIELKKFIREAKYAPIRFSFHAETMEPSDTVRRMLKLRRAGFKVGVWAVDVPLYKKENEAMRKLCEEFELDFRWKEFLAPTYGTYKIPTSVFQTKTRSCHCKTTEILISPSGYIHRCHADLYADRNPIGHMLDRKLPDLDIWRACDFLGKCNPCDQKIKTNRLQEYGHTSVEILENEHANVPS
jgi:MoaA/NifB/PqqE/SkfB family radical SAM enzyme